MISTILPMMESAIRLCPTAPLPRLSNCNRGSGDTSSTRLLIHDTTKFNHASICATHNFPTLLRPIAATRSSIRPAYCTMPNGSSSAAAPSDDNNNGSEVIGNRILRGLAGTSLVMACVLGLFNFNGKIMMMGRTPTMMNAAYASSLLPGGEAAIASLLQTIKAPQNPSKPNQNLTKYSYGEPDINEVEALKLHAVGLSKRGKEGQALKLLETECEKFKGSQSEFSLEMALVELLMFQRKYEEARQRLDHQIDKFVRDDDHADGGGGPSWWHRGAEAPPKKDLSYKDKIDKLLNINDDSDEPFLQVNILSVAQVAQLLLYKAIIQTMLENNESAKWWEAFGKILNENDRLSL